MALISIEEWQKKTDEEVLEASYNDPRVFEVLVKKYEEAFLRKAKKIVFDQEASQDIVQDTFVKIYMYGKGFEPVAGARFSSWAYKILINTCFVYYKKLKRQNEFFSALDEDMEAVLRGDDENRHEEKLDKEYLESLFSRLPETFSRVLRLYTLEGKNYAEIAKAENVSEGAIKTRMHRAREMMKEDAEKMPY
jgi:RNA polymerase sigma-70 factor (ECF subfamily)